MYCVLQCNVNQDIYINLVPYTDHYFIMIQLTWYDMELLECQTNDLSGDALRLTN